MLFRKKSKQNLGQHNCYTTLEELPIQVWFDIHKDGNYSKLVKVNIALTEKYIIELSDIWNKLYNDFITRFGLTDEFMADLRDEIKLANLQADLIITGERYLKTLIRIEQEKKRIMDLEVKEPVGLQTILAQMSKYYGFKLASKELSTAEYYSYINNIIKHGR